jgi:predicted amidohydrolase
MIITIVQFDITWQNAQANLSHLDDILDPIVETDLIILPEMFSTGFTMETSKCSESMGGPVEQWMKALAKKKKSAITGSIIIKEDGLYYNRMLFVFPGNRETEYYDKRHLFGFGREDQHFAPGSERAIVSYNGWRILLQICYDLRFPVFSRNQNDYDLNIYIANFPDKRIQAWNALLEARSIENLSYTVGCNRVGSDPNGLTYQGDSSMYDYSGKRLARISHDESIMSLRIDLEEQKKFRKSFPFLADGDSFTIE